MVCVSLIAYSIDKFFGEFSFIKHPIINIGEMIQFFEDKFYKNSVSRGFLLVLFVLSIVGLASFSISLYLAELNIVVNIIITSIIASMFLAHKMLHDSVKNILHVEDKREAISMLVSRDTKDMSDSDVYKAGIETYAENLSDGVIAPLFYLSIFGLVGIVIYKAVNTMDSMVGYKNERYEKYGKIAAKLDDILNYIPSRITAVLIMLLNKQKKIFSFYKDAKEHDSPNAGHPITAMALALEVKLGGDTSYFGKIKKKAFFGDGREDIRREDVAKALEMRKNIDIFILVFLSISCAVILI